MIAHIQVFYNDDWIPWCEVPLDELMGNAENQAKFSILAEKEGINLSCSHSLISDAQRFMKFMKEHEFPYQMRVINAQCDAVGWENFLENYVN